MLQEIAALGPAVRGKKVALFLSPVWFLPTAASEEREHVNHREFAATFSPSQAGEMATDSPLKPALKRQIATRLLDYEGTVRACSPLLDDTLRGLAGTRPWERCRFEALAPLVRLQNAVLDCQERYHWLELVRAHPAWRGARPAYEARHKWRGWEQLADDVEWSETKAAAGRANFYSLGLTDGERPAERALRSEFPPAAADRDEDFLRRMAAAPEWTDLELLLRTTRQLGVRLLLVDQPINGLYSDWTGVSARARRAYYQRVAQTAAAHGVPVRDFSEYEEDRSFFADAVHPSAKAWAVYDRALDAFYHGTRE